MSALVEVSNTGHVRTIRLNRPEKKNALSQQLAWGGGGGGGRGGPRTTMSGWWRSPAAGDAFCAGLDLSPDTEPYSPYSRQTAMLDDIGWVGQFVLAIRKRCDKPVVGGINGVAVGAGLGLAMATDVRLIAAQRAADGRLYPDRRLAGRGPDHHPAAGHGL